MGIFYIIAATINLAIELLYFALFARAVFSFLPALQGTKADDFVCLVTEPLLAPVRALLEKSETLSSLPVDLSLFVAMLVLLVLQMFLPNF